MSRRVRKSSAEADVQSLLDVLQAYREAHPKADIAVQRQNSASLRIRIIDSDFKGMDRLERHEAIWKILGQAPEEVQSQITFLLLLTPAETRTSFANMEFENPIPSHL